jgi:hypothetical protein
MTPSDLNNKLFVNSAEDYNSTNNYNVHLLEQYKIYLTSAENISNRRQTANAFFVTVNTAIISLISYLHLGVANSSRHYWVIAIVGIAISYMWYRLVHSYKDLNSAKFKVIHEIEKKLPISPYDAEWEAVGRGNNPKLYLPFTDIEIYVPWVFILLHLSVLSIIFWPRVAVWICNIAS